MITYPFTTRFELYPEGFASAMISNAHSSPPPFSSLSLTNLFLRVIADGLAKRSAEAIQDGGFQQTFLQLRDLAGQDLLHQVVLHMDRAAAHPKEVDLGILALFHSQAEQAQPRDPSLDLVHNSGSPSPSR